MLKKLIRFRLRTILILTAFIAAGAGWLTNKWYEHRAEQQLLSEMRSRFDVSLIDKTEGQDLFQIFL